jgi:VCBS repeat-containing protein
MANSFFETSNGGTLSSAGKSVVGLDLNNDGRDDTVFAGGNVTVVYGDAGGFDASVDLATLPTAAGFTLTGTGSDEFGYVVAKAVDLLDDGKDALLIGARQSGIVSVVFSGTTEVGFTVTGIPTDAADGMSLAGLGDINDDGIGDFAIGAPSAHEGAGAVYVIYGNSGLVGTTIDVGSLSGAAGFIIDGFGDNDFAGTSIAGGFDFDGDGANDLLIGAPGSDVTGIGGSEAGAVHIIYGGTDIVTAVNETLSFDETVFGTKTYTGFGGSEFGTAVSAGQDINGDTFDDIIISAPFENGATGSTYVIFGGGTPPDGLGDLDGTNGFKISGVAVASVEMLGDVSGDGIGDLGIVSAAGDVYIVFGDGNIGTGGTVDVTTLNGMNGIALTGLFAGTPTSVSIAALGDVNSDASGPIGDIGIIATFENGTPSASFTVLGGLANFAALDAADTAGGTQTDGKINFATLPVDNVVPFVETMPTIVLTGDEAATINEDTASVVGNIGIDDTTTTTNDPTFAGRTAAGVYGGFVVNGDGNQWTYTVYTDQPTADFPDALDARGLLNSLDAGDMIEDSATLVASNGTQREITITINGLDDPAVLTFLVDGALTPTEDTGQFSGLITLTDPDEDANPVLLAGSITGNHGIITVAANGTFTYVLTDASLQSDLDDGESVTDTIALTVNDGLLGSISYNIDVVIAGADEGIVLNFSDDPFLPDTIFTSFGNDTINALAGDDFVNAGGGNDVVDAGVGDDTVVDPLGDDVVTGGEGNDDILLLSGDNTVNAGIGNDKIVTGFGYDTIDAGEGNDVIAAEEGAIFTFGNNRITGGDGDDYMMGGRGIDVFVFANTHVGSDTIGAFDPDAVTETASGYNVNSTGASFQVGVDKIELQGFGLNQGNVMDSVNYDAGNLVSVFTSGNTIITLINVEITETDFIFV